MKRAIVIAVVLSSIGLVGWTSSSRQASATEYSSVVVQLAGVKLETQAEPVSAELNRRAADGWALASTSTFVGEAGRPVVLLVFSRPGK